MSGKRLRGYLLLLVAVTCALPAASAPAAAARPAAGPGTSRVIARVNDPADGGFCFFGEWFQTVVQGADPNNPDLVGSLPATIRLYDQTQNTGAPGCQNAVLTTTYTTNWGQTLTGNDITTVITPQIAQDFATWLEPPCELGYPCLWYHLVLDDGVGHTLELDDSNGVGGWILMDVGLVAPFTAPTRPEQGGPPNPSENPTDCSRSDPVNCATGDLWYQSADFTIPGRGIPLNFTRSYDSQFAAEDGPFGFGWTGSYNMSLALDNFGDATITQENGSQVTFEPLGSGKFTAPPRVFASLVQNPDGSYTFTRARGGAQYNFSASGQLASEVDRNGYATRLGYNAGGQLASVTDPAGRQLTLAYAGAHVATVTDPMGRIWSYSYDAAGDLVKATDPMDRVTSYAYDTRHRLRTVTDPRGGITKTTYDNAGQVTAQTDPDGGQTSWSYAGDNGLPGGGTTTMTGPDGEVTAYNFASLELTSLTRAAGTAEAATTSYTYDASTLVLTEVTEPDGNQLFTGHDAEGDITYTENQFGQLTGYTYNKFGEVLTETSPLGEVTTYGYDSNGNLLSVTDPLGHVTSYAYADSAHPGDLTSVTDAAGHRTSYTYDKHGDLASVSITASARTSDTTAFGYDADGERTCQATPRAASAHIACPAASQAPVQPVPGTTATTYDADGEVTSVTGPDGRTTSYGYDSDGNLTRLTNPAGQETSYSYNADGRQIKVTRPDGTSLTTGYDAEGNVTTQTDAAGRVTRYAYNPLAQVTSVTRPGGAVTTYGYDQAGHRATVTLPDGQVTSYSYNPVGELASIGYSDGSTPGVTYSYDADGQRTSMTDGTGTTTYAYNADGELTSIAGGNGETVAYGYSADGQLTALTYPNGKTVTRGYNGAGQLASVTDWLGNTTKLGYDQDGNLIKTSYPNGVSSVSAYNTADQLTSITDKTAAATLATLSYARNPLGQITAETGTGAAASSQSYRYAKLSQLAADSSGSYGYDASGNLTRLPDGTTQVFSSADQVTAARRPAPTRPPATDRVVSADESAKGAAITAPALSTGAPGDLILAFISTDGPASRPQKVTTVTGGGLKWSLVARSDARPGTAEIWQADAATVLKNAKITAKLSVSGYDGSISVAAFSGAAGRAAAPAVASGQTGKPRLPFTTTTAQSVIWATGIDPSHATARTTIAGQALVHQFLDAGHSTSWTQKTGPIPGTGAKITVGDTAPTADQWNLAAAEITPAPPAVSTTTYSYDADGDRTKASSPGRPAITLGYDQAGRLIRYGSTSYSYNGDGLRTSAAAGGTTTAFGWDQSGIVPALIAAGPVAYLYGPAGQPVEQIAGSTPGYLLGDSQHSTRLITNPGGAVTGSYAYNPYGQVTSHSGATSALRYDGHYTDSESGYQYLQARYYDPVTGQFLTPDPLASLTLTQYSYVAGDPVNLTDPLGLAATAGSRAQVTAQLTGISNATSTISAVAGLAAIACAIAEPCGAAVAAAAGAIGVAAGAWGAVNDAALQQVSTNPGSGPNPYLDAGGAVLSGIPGVGAAVGGLGLGLTNESLTQLNNGNGNAGTTAPATYADPASRMFSVPPFDLQPPDLSAFGFPLPNQAPLPQAPQPCGSNNI